MRSLKSSFATQFTTQNCEVEILFDHFAELIFAEKGSKIFEKSLFKMDFNDVLLQSFFIYGRYDSKTMHKSKALVYMNNFIAFIELFCTLKMVVIILVPWDRIEIVLYLIDLYIVNGSV